MATQGPNNGGTFADDSTVGTKAWSNPSNAQLSDNNYAIAGSPNSSGLKTTVLSHYLKVTNFGFSIPSGATINGITVSVERKAAGLAGGGAKDNAVRIVKAGNIKTTDKSSATAWPGGDAVATYGSSSDLWGESWTSTDINDSGFGFAISAKGISPKSGGAADIDQITITVDYTAASGTTYDVSISEGIKAGDSISGNVRYLSSITDTGVLGNSASASLRVSTSISDGSKAGDTESASLRAVGTLSEGGKLGDSELGNIVTNRTLTDGGKLGDTQSAGLRFSNTLNDGVRASDSFTPNGSYALTLTEGTAVSDLFVGNVVLVMAWADAATFGDVFRGGVPLVQISGQGELVATISGHGIGSQVISGAGMLIDIDGSGSLTVRISGSGTVNESIGE